MINTLKSLTGWTAAASLAMLAACGGGGGGGGALAPTTTNNTIVITPSPTGTISVAVGSSQAFSATFTTDDGKTATNLSITSGLSALPAGWTGPTSFTCASVSTGNGCMVNLTYKPTAVGSGSVTFDYSYVNNAGTSKTGTATVSYAATSADNNNVVATPSPAGQIAVMTGGKSTVSIAFTTDDGKTATNLSITAGLSALPAGWSGPATFTCPSLSTGSGCVLNLTYAPTKFAMGTLALSYSYTNNAGTPKTGSISIPYIATTQNSVIGTPAPAGQIVAVLGGSQLVKVNFTTDDSHPASSFAVTPASLASLPAGWTGPATFPCASVSTGNGCELGLTYTPTQTGSGTVTLNFGYKNDSGAAKTGTVNIAYAATVDNAVIGTPSPSGTVNAVVATGNQPVTVTFNSNDGNPATNLKITGGLSPLPVGWSGPSTLTCALVNTAGGACQLSLKFAPAVFVSGTLQLNYSYNANSGAAHTGSVNIPYAATTHNTLVWTPSPSAPSAVVNSAPLPVTLTFTTSDNHPATAIKITSGLNSLPPDWSSPGGNTFTCASASTGTGCQLALIYAPTVKGSGSVALGYSYNDDAGTPQTGTASINYASIPQSLYITDTVSNVVRCTMSGSDGSLSSCAPVATGLVAPTGIAFSGKYAYVTPGKVATDVDVCLVNSDGSLGTCTGAYTANSPNALAVSGGYLYVSDAGGGGNVYSCTINADGSLTACNTSNIGTVDTTDGIAVTANNAFIVDTVGGNLTTCTVSSTDGTLSPCAQQTLVGSAPGGGNTPKSTPTSATVYGGNVYMGTHAAILITPISVAVGGTLVSNYPCALASKSGTVAPCVIDDLGPVQTPVTGLVFNNGYAYASGYGSGGGIGICTIEASGIVDKCTTSSSLPSGSGNYGGMAVH